MTARRNSAVAATIGFASLVLVGPAAVEASAHGSLTNPVSRVSACFSEGPESPDSAACRAMVAAGGTQALYDWNEVNIADAHGDHRSLIPDGELCGAGREKYRGLDLPRSDWPSTAMSSGTHDFRYRANAPHRGAFELYITKDGYDPAQPLKWSDLESEPFATAADPVSADGGYTFTGTVPERSGRHLIYSVWQRSDSPEAFYSCSDVVFGGDSEVADGEEESAAPATPGLTATAPSDQQISAGTDRSTVDHAGHGGPTAAVPGAPVSSAPGPTAETNPPVADAPVLKGSTAPLAEETLAATGSDSTVAWTAVGGAAFLVLGSSLMPAVLRRKAVATGRHRN